MGWETASFQLDSKLWQYFFPQENVGFFPHHQKIINPSFAENNLMV